MTPALERRVAATWAFRARAEVEAAARFERLSLELGAVGASPEIVDGCRAAADDERRHAKLCAAIAEAHGLPSADDHLPPRERVGRVEMNPRGNLLWEMVAVCCIGETMNTALLGRCLEVATVPSICDALRSLLRDEIRHARLGWAHLANEAAHERTGFLGPLVPLMLAASVDADFFSPGETEVSPDFAAYGELVHRERVLLFRDTSMGVIFPGLDRHRVDTDPARAWLSASMLSSPP